MEFEYKLIDNIEIEGIDWDDAHDFCDAFITSADYDGVEMTDEQLDDLNDNHREFVYDEILNSVY